MAAGARGGVRDRRSLGRGRGRRRPPRSACVVAAACSRSSCRCSGAGPACAGERRCAPARRARVAAMIGRDGDGDAGDLDRGPEFPPVLDLDRADPRDDRPARGRAVRGRSVLLAAARLLVGAVFLGSVSDAMLLGHWYLVQPGLPRGPVKELVAWTAVAWPFEIAVFLWPTGMVQVINGDDRRRLSRRARLDLDRLRGARRSASSASPGPRCASATTPR